MNPGVDWLRTESAVAVAVEMTGFSSSVVIVRISSYR